MGEDPNNGLAPVRWWWLVFVGFAVAEIGISEYFAHDRGPISPITFWILTVLALYGALGVRTFKRRLIDVGRAQLQTNPLDPKGFRRARAGYLMNFVIGNSVVMYGFLLRFLGAERMHVVPFYVLGLGLIAMFWPRT